MASVWFRLQIPSFISPKDSKHQRLLLRASSVATENIRSFWFRKSKKPIEYGGGNCGQPPPKRMVEPCRGCPSKCLETTTKKKGFFSFRKKPIKKPTNCEEEKPVEEELTLWESMFGPDPRRSWPDPCTCRLAHRQRKLCRARDPRLADSRYKETAGDVFLYTEVAKRKKPSCLEPQPTPPPPFKVPKEVLFRRMSVDELASLNRLIKIDKQQQPQDVSSSTIKPLRIPYEELRPPERRKKPMFSCQRGIRSEDVRKPIKKGANFYKIASMGPQLNSCQNLEESKKEIPVCKTQKDQKPVKRSRIEQLKFLVGQKDTFRCMGMKRI